MTNFLKNRGNLEGRLIVTNALKDDNPTKANASYIAGDDLLKQWQHIKESLNSTITPPLPVIESTSQPMPAPYQSPAQIKIISSLRLQQERRQAQSSEAMDFK
jgi:hypothetical protein